MFCNACLAIFSRNWSFEHEEWSHSVSGPHYSDVSGLRSASRHCRICNAIWLECIVGFGNEDWTNAEVRTMFTVRHQSTSIVDAVRQGRTMELQIKVSRSLGSEEIHRVMAFDLLPYNAAEHRHPNDSEPDSSLETMLGWYRNCLENHQECRPIFDGSYLPTRMIDIHRASSPEPTRLVTTENFHTSTAKHLRDHFPYATLSHCWGKSQPLRLLTRNMEQMKQGILRVALPRVFNEAIEVCWKLGIQYLWIDSLCICQDSEEDWIKESSQMGKVYSSAVINIAATGSTDCHGSLWDATRKCPSVGVVSWAVVPESEYVVVENSIEWAKSFLGQPLLRRAWVQQERHLATRMIHFAKSGLVWECRTTAATESYPIQVPDALRPFHDRRNRFWREDFIEDDGAWSVLIADYSKCELTFNKDKLVALYGLVSALESKGLARGRYWAGIFEADLPYCLLWTRAAMDKARWPRVRPDNYRAPSWSWASLDCPIWTEWASGTAESPLVSLCEVKGDDITSSTGSQLSICIVGPVTKANITRKRAWVEAFGRGVERVQGISYSVGHILSPMNPEHNGENVGTAPEVTKFWDDPWNDVIFDDLDEANLEKDVWLAPIYECEKWTEGSDAGMRLLGLLLEEVKTDLFRRIGAFSIGHRSDQDALKQLPALAYEVI